MATGIKIMMIGSDQDSCSAGGLGGHAYFLVLHHRRRATPVLRDSSGGRMYHGSTARGAAAVCSLLRQVGDTQAHRSRWADALSHAQQASRGSDTHGWRAAGMMRDGELVHPSPTAARPRGGGRWAGAKISLCGWPLLGRVRERVVVGGFEMAGDCGRSNLAGLSRSGGGRAAGCLRAEKER